MERELTRSHVHRVVRFDTDGRISLRSVRVPISSGLDDEIASESVQVDAEIILMFMGRIMEPCRHHK